MKFTINKDKNGYLLSVAHTAKDDTEITNLDEYNDFLSCCVLYNNRLVLDEEKKKEYDQQTVKYNTELRKQELHRLLNESDYLVARTFEQVMSCTNPLTFITDIIAIITKFSAQYGEVIANRQTWRDELEAMEGANNE